jgi:hypothetical protein
MAKHKRKHRGLRGLTTMGPVSAMDVYAGSGLGILGQLIVRKVMGAYEESLKTTEEKTKYAIFAAGAGAKLLSIAGAVGAAWAGAKFLKRGNGVYVGAIATAAIPAVWTEVVKATRGKDAAGKETPSPLEGFEGYGYLVRDPSYADFPRELGSYPRELGAYGAQGFGYLVRDPAGRSDGMSDYSNALMMSAMDEEGADGGGY